MINLSGGIGRAIKRVVSAPFKAVGKVLGVGGSQTVNVSAPDVSAAQVVPSTASPAPEAPVLGTENKTQGRKRKGSPVCLSTTTASLPIALVTLD